MKKYISYINIVIILMIITFTIIIISNNKIQEFNKQYSTMQVKALFEPEEKLSMLLSANETPIYTRGTENSEYVTFEYTGKEEENTGVNINTINSSCNDASFYYRYQGLEAQEMYSISTYVKIDSIDKQQYDGGAFIADWNNSFSTSEVINQTTSSTWIKITIVAISEKDGTIKVKFGLKDSKADVTFDQMEIMKAQDNNEFKVYTYTNWDNKTGKVVFWKSDTIKYLYNEETMELWLSTLLDIREDMRMLTSKQVDNGNVNIIATNYQPWIAYVLSGRVEIQWNRSSVETWEENADTPFFITHEMGHQHTVDNINYDGEFWGTTLGLLSDYRLNLRVSGLAINGQGEIRQGDELIDYCYNGGYQEYINSNYSGDGLTYLLFKTILKLDEYEKELGFNSLAQTLAYFNDEKVGNPGGAGNQFIAFIKKWSEYSGKDVKSIIYGFRNGDATIIDNKFAIGKFGYTVNNDGKTITINSCSRNWEDNLDDTYELVIPSQIDGYTVTEIGGWAFCYNDYIEEIVLPSTVTAIGRVAFYECKNLISVKIPPDSKLVTIEEWAFCRSGLGEIYIPPTVENIGDYVLLWSNNTMTIKGYTGTKIHKYAQNNNINFVSVDNYTVTFNTNGGKLESGVANTKSVIGGEIYGELPIPTKQGYIFYGWYNENEQEITETTIYDLSEDSTLHAQWKLPDDIIGIEITDFNNKKYVILSEQLKIEGDNIIKEGITVENFLQEKNFPNTNYKKEVYNVKGEKITGQELIATGGKVDILNQSGDNVTTYYTVIKGDINGDGIVNIFDITLEIELYFEKDDSKEWTDAKKIAGWCIENHGRTDGIPDIFDIARLIEYNFENKLWT